MGSSFQRLQVGRFRVVSSDISRGQSSTNARGGIPSAIACRQDLEVLMRPSPLVAAPAFRLDDARNAEVGFIALFQLCAVADGTRWLVPQDLYSPIRQDAVLHKKGADDERSKAFI